MRGAAPARRNRRSRRRVARRGSRATAHLLHVHILYVGAQRSISLIIRADATLNEVSCIPRRPKGGRAYTVEYVHTTARDVAIDLLLVLMKERDPGILRLAGHNPHPVEHLFSIVARLMSFGDEEGENAYVRCLHDIGGVHGAPETLQVR